METIKDLNQQIKEDAIKHGSQYSDVHGMRNTLVNAFEKGAKSNSAKAFHQQEMFSKEEVEEIIKNSYSYGYMDRDKDIGFGSNLPYALEQLK